MKFRICNHCGNMVGMVVDSGVPMMCCGEKMAELAPNTVDASHEKHVPAVTKTGNTVAVQVGSAAHPMEDKHHIAFIYLQTKSGGQKKSLKIGDQPSVSFAVVDDEPTAVYAYCNLHGLWKCDL